MHASCGASRRPGFGRPLAAVASLCLAGCNPTGTVAGAAPWLAALVLLLVAALAYALGVARTRLAARALPASRPAEHPAAPPDERAALAAAAAHVQASTSGHATATAGDSDGPALLNLLDLQAGAAWVARQDEQGLWQVPVANAAAQALWPRLNWPASLDDVMAQLPARAGSDTARAEESDNFSFTASHDLRAPIRVVEGFTRIVKEDYGHLLDRVGNDHLDRVLGAAARMNLMIDALLTLARLSQQPLARQPVNLSQLAGYIVDELKRAEPGREADIDIQADLSAMGDPTLLRLVLENLLSNAWKYSGKTARAQISLRTVPHAGGLAYVVRDNGAGFDMRSADRLFGLFQRLHSASEFPGHGVGLASVRRIVQRHGGEIWAEAEPGSGAAFFFTIC